MKCELSFYAVELIIKDSQHTLSEKIIGFEGMAVRFLNVHICSCQRDSHFVSRKKKEPEKNEDENCEREKKIGQLKLSEKNRIYGESLTLENVMKGNLLPRESLSVR